MLNVAQSRGQPGRSFHPEPWIDRKGRLKGNLLALVDMAIGRISPHRILQLD